MRLKAFGFLFFLFMPTTPDEAMRSTCLIDGKKTGECVEFYEIFNSKIC